MNAMPATESDIPTWLEIVREVEPLFGPMPDFEVILDTRSCCVESSNG